ncbi:hypothetical protein BD779DRAFT_1693506 [Infundibulicybe gibba]|nr:hypothetical protein BD779DRAFT_1693506 [Infundibulicybe gibba]
MPPHRQSSNLTAQLISPCNPMAFSNATDFQIDRSTFNDIRGDYNQRIQLDFNQQINVHARDQDIPNRLYSVMKNHISTAAYHNSGMRREISSCHPGTREVALKIISDWAEDPASHCLWLRGPAGTGKSAIAYTIAERCRLDRTLGATYFFARGSITNSPPHFFPTLAYQLALAVPDLRDPLCTALCEDPAVLDKSMSEQLDTLIVQPLLTLSNQPEHTVIIIDGLDEYDCTRGPAIQTDIVRLILGLGEHSFPLRFIISSRPETGIRRAFESPCSSLTHLPLDTVDPLRDILLPRSPLNTMYPDRDIRRFLYDKLGQVYEDCVKDKTLVALRTTWPPYEAIEQLVKKSSGHFIYASTVVKFIQEGHGNPVDRLEAVLQAPSATAFQELDQLYLHILRKAGDPEELKWILRAIMYLDDKAKLVSNLEAIFSRISGIRFLLGNLRSIVEVTKLSEAIPVCEHISEFLEVRFFHASMNDFLLDPARSCEFYVSLGQFQAGLAFEYARLIIL